MHFTTLFILKGEELENISLYEIEELFYERYCYGSSDYDKPHKPRYEWWCDWFKVGGRWCDILVANKGIVGERSWCNQEEEQEPNHFSIVEIKDLKEPINEDSIYAVATKSRIYQDGDEKYHSLIEQINSKQFDGVIALIDCHD